MQEGKHSGHKQGLRRVPGAWLVDLGCFAAGAEPFDGVVAGGSEEYQEVVVASVDVSAWSHRDSSKSV
jgi:hypothetical protein